MKQLSGTKNRACRRTFGPSFITFAFGSWCGPTGNSVLPSYLVVLSKSKRRSFVSCNNNCSSTWQYEDGLEVIGWLFESLVQGKSLVKVHLRLHGSSLLVHAESCRRWNYRGGREPFKPPHEVLACGMACLAGWHVTNSFSMSRTELSRATSSGSPVNLCPPRNSS